MSKYNKNHYVKQTYRGWIRKQYLIEISGGGCKNCNYNKCSRCLSFHHRDPKCKKFNLDIRNIGNHSWNTVLDEFNKCDLLCMNCHGEHHDSETDKEYVNYVKKIRGSKICFCLNCGKEFKSSFYTLNKKHGKYCSRYCANYCSRKTNHPNKEELLEMIWKYPTTQLALQYNVSDKAIEKWCKKYKINKPCRGYWQKIKALTKLSTKEIN